MKMNKDIIDNIILIATVCFEVDKKQILGHNRRPRIVKARHAVWNAIRNETDLSYPEIAEIFGCDHSTIVKAVKQWRVTHE